MTKEYLKNLIREKITNFTKKSFLELVTAMKKLKKYLFKITFSSSEVEDNSYVYRLRALHENKVLWKDSEAEHVARQMSLGNIVLCIELQ